MKWGKIESSEIKNWLIIIICVLVILGMLVDFISWRTALSILKQELPTGYHLPTQYTFLRGYGYVPLVWRGNFSRIYLMDYKNPTPDLHDYLIFEITGHNLVLLNVSSLGENLFYGTWKQTPAAAEYIKQKFQGWEKIQQPFGTYAEVYVKIQDNKVLVVVFGEDRVYTRQFKCRTGEGRCGGGYVNYYWP